MKNKPRINYWTTAVDRGMLAVHAVRAWDVPSNGVFILVTPHERYGVTLQGKYQPPINWAAQLVARLDERERIIVREYGRQARYNLTVEIGPDDKPIDGTQTWPADHLR